MSRQWWLAATSSLVGEGLAAAMSLWLLTHITDPSALPIVWAVTSVLLALCIMRGGMMLLLAAEALWLRVAAWVRVER